MSDGVVVKNIYYMMAYAFKALALEEYAHLGHEEFDGVEDLLAAILTIGIDSQRRRGFERGYVVMREDIARVRGRVMAARTVRLRALASDRVSCEWGELTEDTYNNRILKTIGSLLATSELVRADRRSDLRRSLLALRDVGSLDPARIEWSRLRYHRNNASYQLLMNVCHMVVSSMLLTRESGESRLASFKDARKLYALYERFVLEWFKRHHPELHPSARVISRSMGSDAPSFLPQLVTDVTLRGPTRTLIIDCKCYGRILHTHHSKEIATPAHVNQIFSYVVHEAHGTEREVSGMLLYALTDVDRTQNTGWADLGHDFYLWTLDLGKSFTSIERRLEQVAALVVGCACWLTASS